MHTIRLRGPWELESLTDSAQPRARCHMPADWSEALGREYSGVVRYTRTFNRPTNLEPHERVWLVVEPPRSRGIVRMNAQELGQVALGDGAGRFDITAHLKPHNALEIDVEHRDPVGGTGGLIGEVRLEIESS